MSLLSLDSIRQAADRIRGLVRRTPLVEASDASGVPRVLLKCENLQYAGAFKIRGASNMIARLAAAGQTGGVITYSSGNHGQAVALAARRTGMPAVVVMPTTAPAMKADGARRLGAEVIFEGRTSLDRKARAEAEAATRHLTMVPPFDHEWIIAGQGTVGLEILDDCPEPGAVLVQIGGGGLISGVAAAVKALRPSTRVIGVEPAGAAKMKASRAAGRPVALAETASIADGLLPLRPGDLTFAHVQAFVDDLVTVTDEMIARAVLWLYGECKLVVEPSGATAVAAVLAALEDGDPNRFGRGPIVAVLSGGHLAVESLATLARNEAAGAAV
jgi:threonine dehydratase